MKRLGVRLRELLWKRDATRQAATFRASAPAVPVVAPASDGPAVRETVHALESRPFRMHLPDQAVALAFQHRHWGIMVTVTELN